MKFIADPEFNAPEERLELLVRKYASQEISLPLLGQLYEDILICAFNCTNDLAQRMNFFLGVILLLQEPLALSDLAELLQIPSHSIYNSLQRLRSIVDIPLGRGDPSSSLRTIQVVHCSLAEYIFGVDDSEVKPWTVNIQEQQVHLLKRCLEVIKASQAQAREELELPEPRPRQQDPFVWQWESLLLKTLRRVPQCVQYACRYWLRHLLALGSISDDPTASAGSGEVLRGEIAELVAGTSRYWAAVCRTLGIAGELSAQLHEILGGLIRGVVRDTSDHSYPRTHTITIHTPVASKALLHHCHCV